MKLTRRGFLGILGAAPAVAVSSTALAETALPEAPMSVANSRTIWLSCGKPFKIFGLDNRVKGLGVPLGYPYRTSIIEENTRGITLWPEAYDHHVVYSAASDEFFFADGAGGYLLIVDAPVVETPTVKEVAQSIRDRLPPDLMRGAEVAGSTTRGLVDAIASAIADAHFAARARAEALAHHYRWGR